MVSKFKKALHLLALIDKTEYMNLNTLLTFESELADNLDLLIELDLVTKENNEYILTNKGKNIIQYYDKPNMENAVRVRASELNANLKLL